MPEQKTPEDVERELAHPPVTPADPPPSEATTTVRLTVPHSEADGAAAGKTGDVVEVPADQAERMIAAGTAEAVGAGGQQRQQSAPQPAQGSESGSAAHAAGPSGPIRRPESAAPDAESDDDKDEPRVPRRR